jgi:hypothetical protein
MTAVLYLAECWQHPQLYAASLGAADSCATPGRLVAAAQAERSPAPLEQLTAVLYLVECGQQPQLYAAPA